MGKSPDAFRTISEVADWLGIQAHVLRFWESKFTQVKPIKRAGGRRYYRPNDMLLLGGIKQLLHEDGLTIKGVQKILREEGMGHVSAMSPPLDELTQSEVAEAEETPAVSAPPDPMPEDKGVILNFDPAPVEDEIKNTDEAVDEDDEVVSVAADQGDQQAPVQETPEAPQEPVSAAPTDAAEQDDADAPSEPAPVMPTFRRDVGSVTEDTGAETADEPAQTDAAASTPAALPAFLRRPLGEDGGTPAVTDNPPAPEPPVEDVAPAPEPEPEPALEPEAPPAPKPRILDLPPFKAAADFEARPAALSAAYKVDRLTADQARQIAPMLDKLIALRGRMSAQRRDPAKSPSND